MNSAWTIAPKGGAECGNCSRRIEPGEPMECLTSTNLRRVLRRCVEHAHSVIDHEAVEAARKAEDIARLQREAQIVAVKRFKLARPVTGFKQLADVGAATFDPKQLAAGERE